METGLAILDLDMTLLDTLRAFHRVYNEALQTLCGRSLGWEEFVDCFCRDMLSEKAASFGCRPREVWRLFKEGYLPRREETKPYPGVRGVLSWLRDQGYRVVIATGRGTGEEHIWRELGWVGLEGYVSAVYTLSGDEGGGNLFSKARLLRRIVEEHGSPGRVFFVGDYWLDMVSGRRAGIYTVGVETGCKKRTLLLYSGANAVVEGIWLLPFTLTVPSCVKS